MTAVMEPDTELDTDSENPPLTPADLADLDGITFEVVWVTPAMARKWLGMNIPNNRIVRDTKTDEIASDMRNGLWRLTGEAIKFDVNGDFVDGQHRLLGLIDSGVDGVPMIVARGVPVDAVEVMDSGTARRFADNLRMQESVNRFASAAIVRRVWQYDQGNPAGISGRSNILRKPTKSELMICYRASRSQFDAAAMRGYDFSRLRMCSATAGGIMAFLLNRHDPDNAPMFIDQVIAGANIGTKHPAHALRTRLFREKRLDTTVAMGLFIRAWNCWIRDEETDKLQLTRKGELNNGNWPKMLSARKNRGGLATGDDLNQDRDRDDEAA